MHRSRTVFGAVLLAVLLAFAFPAMPTMTVAAQEEAGNPLICALPVEEISGQGGLTVGALGLTPGALGLTPGALALTPGALGLTPGALELTLEGLGLTPGALGGTDEQIAALIQEILNNLIDGVWLDEQLDAAGVEAGFLYKSEYVALLVIDDFEDVETDFLSHGELVEQIATEVLAAAGLADTVQIYRVDITNGVADFVVDGPNGIAARIEQKVNDLRSGINPMGHAYTRFVLNMSFGLIPCEDPEGDWSIEEFISFRDELVPTEPKPINGVLECVAHNPDGTYTAHFGYVNENPYPVVLPYGPNNRLSGGGLDPDELVARTPFFFGVAQDNPGRPGRSNFYPDSAFQVSFDTLPLVWTHPGGTSTAGANSPVCAPVASADEGYAVAVVSFDQGLNSRGHPVADNRSQPEQALGQPQNTNTLNFVALGFGGQLVLDFGEPRFANPYGPDLRIAETSFGNPSDASYPERVTVELSQDGVNFVLVAADVFLDEDLEFPDGLNWARYIRLTDTTDLDGWLAGRFGTGDGYDVDGVVTCDGACVPDVQPIFECAAFDESTGRYIAHFGYLNLKGVPHVIEHGPDRNELVGGGLSPAELDQRTPELFGYPNVVASQPGRTQGYPNSAFQVQFDGLSPLTWRLLGPDGTLREATATFSEETACPDIPKVADVTFKDYLGTQGIDLEPLLNAASDPTLNDLVPLLQSYLDESADNTDFALIPFAAAGNFAPTLGPAPLAPANFDQTIAISALLGQNPGTFAAFSQAGNIAVPGAWYAFQELLFGAGTSYATPFAAAYASAFLTYDDPDACDFQTAAGSAGVPLVEDDPQVYDNLPIGAELDCLPPEEPVTVPMCAGQMATVYVQDGIIVGGRFDGRVFQGALRGTNGDDVIVGTEGNDIIDAFGGDDLICGLGGDDILDGDQGDNIIYGGEGNDNMRALGGDDTFYGEGGDDTVQPNPGADTLYGGPGNDSLSGGPGNDMIDGGPGDYDDLFGNQGNDTLTDEDGVFRAYGDQNRDTIILTFREGWVSKNGQPRVDGRIKGGNRNDLVCLTVFDSIFFNITGDEPGNQGGANDGNFDRLYLNGPFNPGSVFIKFEEIYTDVPCGTEAEATEEGTDEGTE